VSAGPLGRLTPPDFDHVAASPLKALGAEAPTCVPVSLGIPWYTSFDSPVQLPDGSWHLPAANGNLGTVRGGHCVCLAPMGAVRTDEKAWWRFYNQGQEGACEGFGHSRAMTLLRRETFDAFWLYDQARRLEGTYPDGEGTTNKAVCEVLEQQGLCTQTGAVAERVDTELPVQDADGVVEERLGISRFRWATTAEEVCNALGRPNALAVPLLNSWGESYPEVCWLPVDTLERLLHEEGEADVITEK
jgi:hypothetical protein